MSGSVIYDMFMGSSLNPRLGGVDLKMWGEIRIPWIILFYITVSATVKEYETNGKILSLSLSLSHISFNFAIIAIL